MASGNETSFSVDEIDHDDTTTSEVWTDGGNTNTSTSSRGGLEGTTFGTGTAGPGGLLSKVEEVDEDRTTESRTCYQERKEFSFASVSEVTTTTGTGGADEDIDNEDGDSSFSSSKFTSNTNIEEILDKIEKVSKAGEALGRALEDPSLNESMLMSVLEKAVQGSDVNLSDLRTLPGPSSKRELDEEQAKIDELLADISSGNKSSKGESCGARMNLDEVLQEYEQLEKSLYENPSDEDQFDVSLASGVSQSSSLTRASVSKSIKSQKNYYSQEPSSKSVSKKAPPPPPEMLQLPQNPQQYKTAKAGTSSLSSIFSAEPVNNKPAKKSEPIIVNPEDRPISVRSSQSSPVMPSSPLSSARKSPLKLSRKTNASNVKTGPTEEEILMDKITQLEKEVNRQDNMIVAFQEENTSLLKKLKDNEGEWQSKVGELEDLVGSLKTEIATLKIARLSGVGGVGGSPGKKRPNSTESLKLQKELERIKVESETKSMNIQELRKEVIKLQNKLNEVLKKPKGEEDKLKASLEDKNKTITQLERRVRSLQKILYSKHGAGEGLPEALLNSPMALFCPEKLATALGGRGQIDSVLQKRVEELEYALEVAAQESKGKLQEFNAKLHALKGKYEDQLDEAESKLAESERRLKLLEDSSTFEKTQSELRTRLERTQAEVLHWRQENTKLRRDLELRDKALAVAEKKTVINASSGSTQGDAGTLALALKSFRREMADKDKELLKLKKEVNEFKKTNVSLKKEREKLLLLQHGLTTSTGNSSSGFGGAALRKSTVPPSELQLVLEKEREEYGRLLDAKGAEVEKKTEEIRRLERLVRDLQNKVPPDHMNRHQVTQMRNDSSSSPSLESQIMIEQLQGRLETQNGLISRMRDHLKVFQGIDVQALKGDNLRLQEEVKDLRKRLEIADSLKRPENEVLDVLSRKLELLEGRYLEREKTLENLLRRVAVGGGGRSNNGGRSQWGDICELSPTTMSLTLLSTGD